MTPELIAYGIFAALCAAFVWWMRVQGNIELMKKMQEKTGQSIARDGDGQVLREGDRVYCYDLSMKRCYGTIHKNADHPHVSEWYISYDDGEKCAVLEMSLVFKV